MSAEYPYDVFLSHNSADKPRVRRLAEQLRAAGLRVWFDEWIVEPGADIYLAVERGLEASRTLVLCLSPAATASDWVSLERSTGIFRDPANANRRFIPLLLADCKLPDTLRRYKYVDYRDETEAAVNELLNCVCPVSKLRSSLDSWIRSQQDSWPQAIEEAALVATRHLVSVLTTTTVLVRPDGTTFGNPKEQTRHFQHRLIWDSHRTFNSLCDHLTLVKRWSQNISIAGMRRPKKLDDLYVELSLTDDPRQNRLGVKAWDSYTIPDILQENASFVVLGEPGSGKTTTLKKIANGFIVGEYPSSLPILVRLRDIRPGQRLIPLLMNVLEVEFSESKELLAELAAQEEAQREAQKKEYELIARQRTGEESVMALRRELERLEEEEQDVKRRRNDLTAHEQAAAKRRADRRNELKRMLKAESERAANAAPDVKYAERISFKLAITYAISEIRALAAFLNSLRVILLLDGFDELGPDTRPGVLDEIQQLQKALSSSRIVLTCRSADYYGGLEGVLVYEINRLSPEQIERFVRLWFCSDEGRQRTAEDFTAALSVAPYADLAGRPLSLANLCLVFEKYGALPELPTTIYRKILYLLLEEWDTERGISRKSKYAHFDASRKVDFLSALAFELATSRNRRLTFSTSDLESIYSKVHRRFLLPPGEARDVAHEIESHTGIVVKASYDTFEFSHKSLQEFLVADYLCRLPDALVGEPLLRDCPNEVAIALVLTVEPSHWFCRLFRNKKQIPGADWVLPFVERVLAERPGFEPTAELGSTVLWMLGNTPFRSVTIQRFLGLEEIAESLRLFFGCCAVEVPMGPRGEKHRIVVRGSVPAKYPVPRSFLLESSDLEFLPARETLGYIFLGKIAEFNLKSQYGYIDTGRPGERPRFEFSSLRGSGGSSLRLHHLLEYELDKASKCVVGVHLIPDKA